MKIRRCSHLVLVSCLLVSFVLLSVGPGVAQAATLTVSWQANTEEDLAGYRIHYGTASRTYSGPVTVDKDTTTHQLSGLSPYTTYYVALTAFDLSGNESGYSEEASATTVCDVFGTYYRDADGDGYGSAADSVQACQAPAGYVISAADCNDANAAINPAAGETCDGLDNDCNGLIDDGLPLGTYYRDADGDGYGRAADSVQACQAPAGYVISAADCDDADPFIHPGAGETCGDGIDQDCDGADGECSETHFPRPAREAEYLTAQGTIEVDHTAGEPGDEVAVFDPDGVCCGQASLNAAGSYGPLYINLDDPATPEDEGAAEGDRLVFKVWDASSAAETTAHIQMTDLGGDLYQVDLKACYQETIPLQAGWNLVSFATGVCYYSSPEPPAVPMLPGVAYQQVSGIGEVLSSIDGYYEVVRGFDAYGAHTFDPAAPEVLSDLDYLAPGYGYWIRATAPCELTLTGGRISPMAALELAPGWNLMGYWGHEVNFVGAPPEVAFAGPPAELTMIERPSAAELFAAIEGMYGIIYGFDLDGAHTYRPGLPDFINDLHYAGPGYGYWVYMNGAGYLSY